MAKAVPIQRFYIDRKRRGQPRENSKAVHGNAGNKGDRCAEKTK